ncbi:hypothetical protein [Sandaracinus amylolyticus]|uniref:Uncharacterized protein n=1 Tax=Sandaracinus amylolyticus TaxID=927083 RepID=A0A0F6W4Z6_9BACT|nr:hypothetical protein [Sandaracinus amylolyticus]AKF07415.1 hypothetical protein DB32_004564 [Sandaracinus amylolyticus]
MRIDLADDPGIDIERHDAPDPAVLRALAAALRSLSKGGRESVYEVDVIMRCSPVPPWRVHAAFWWCVDRGWLTPASREPDAFVVAPGAWSALESGAFQREPSPMFVAQA